MPDAALFPLRSRTGRRIHFMDEIRGFDLILMIFFHAFYVIGYLFDYRWGRTLFQFFNPVEPFFAGLFIFICGISCRLSHSNWKRGGLLLLVSTGMSVFLYLFLPDEMIWFGILHFLAVSILLFALLRPLLDKIPPWAGLAACALLLLLTWWVPVYRGGVFGIKGLLSVPVPASLQENVFLYPLGLSDADGADYFPLLPWFFCFLAGGFTGVWAKEGRFFHVQKPPALALLAGTAHPGDIRPASAGGFRALLGRHRAASQIMPHRRGNFFGFPRRFFVFAALSSRAVSS